MYTDLYQLYTRNVARPFTHTQAKKFMKISVVLEVMLTLTVGSLLFAEKGRGGRGKDRAAKATEKEEAEEGEEA
ncbi:MAG: hypothetical protein JWM11_4491 [Planctomycetaceae bacterium]|nr:hypothetical protein [Planctomycetaceae bacterium]